MSRRRILAITALFSLVACGESSVVEPTVASAPPSLSEIPAQASPHANTSVHLADLHALQAAFHGALNASDADAMYALWAPEAVVWAAPIGCAPCIGPTEITEAFATSGPFINGWASLAPSYKSSFDIQGNTAEYAFECVYVQDGANLTGNPVLAHLNATGTMRKMRDRWVFQTFQAGAGSL